MAAYRTDVIHLLARAGVPSIAMKTRWGQEFLIWDQMQDSVQLHFMSFQLLGSSAKIVLSYN
jgi:hypothetical protein